MAISSWTGSDRQCDEPGRRFSRGDKKNLAEASAAVVEEVGSQPGTSIGPMAVSRCGRDPERGPGLLDRQPGVIAEPHQHRGGGVLGAKPHDGLIQGEEQVWWSRDGQDG